MDDVPRAMGLHLSPEQLDQMRSHVSARIPEEACGLIVGQVDKVDYRSIQIIPITNMLHSAVRFRMEPLEQLSAFQVMDEKAWELVGIYHSHPEGPLYPSPTDIGEALYPKVIQLIWSFQNQAWQVRGFLIQDGKVQDIPIITTPTE